MKSWHGDDHDPGALGELGDKEHHGGDGGDHRAEPVDDGPPSPSGGRSRRQCTTRPVWESVKPTNTPIANSGMSVLVLPRTAIMRAAAISRKGEDSVGEDLPVAP